MSGARRRQDGSFEFRELACVYFRKAASAATNASGARPARRREVVMRAPLLRTTEMRAAPFQFFGNLSELGREFEQRLPRVDLRRLFRELQAFFGMLAAFFRRRHGGDPAADEHRPCPIPSSTTPSTGRSEPRRPCRISHPDATASDDAECTRCRGIMHEPTVLSDHPLPAPYSVRKEDILQLCRLLIRCHGSKPVASACLVPVSTEHRSRTSNIGGP
jgi:hypothetical protein